MKKRATFLPFVSLVLIVILISFLTGLLVGKTQSVSQKSVVKTTPSPTQITPTPSPATIYELKDSAPSKIALHIDTIDYSQGHTKGLVKDVRVQLFNMDGTLIEEKTPSPYIQNGPVGTGGDTIFYVLPSTYKIVADTGSTYGTCIVTVRSTTEYNSCAIYLVNKKP